MKTVVAVAGMPGAGKATFHEIAKSKGLSVVVMGDEIREETKHRGLKPTPENIGKIMFKLRKEEGPAVVAKRCIPEIDSAKGKIVFVDGLRSGHEVEEFKSHFPSFVLIAVHSSPETRFQRLFRRRRSDDPEGWEAFLKRERRELKVGLGDTIAMADFMIVNEGTKEEFKRKIHEVLKAVLKKWMK